MKPVYRVVAVALVVFAAGWIVMQKNRGQTEDAATARNNNEPAAAGTISPQHSRMESPTGSAEPAISEGETAQSLPQLIDLGADKCIPCKMMAPILEELRGDYTGRMTVRFIDVWKNPDAGKEFGIRVIPTQIFIDAGGKELFRHEGFYSKADILSRWQELGVDLGTD